MDFCISCFKLINLTLLQDRIINIIHQDLVYLYLNFLLKEEILSFQKKIDHIIYQSSIQNLMTNYYYIP